MKNKVICNKCDKKFQHGKQIGYRWFYDSNWEFYSCGGQKFLDEDYLIPPKYTCGDCNTNKDKGIPYNS
jgi:hypothetical protein